MIELEKTTGVSPIILQWEPAMYSNGRAFVADRHVDNLVFRYLVRRAAPHNKLWVALRDSAQFDKPFYASKEEAVEACQTDAITPKSSLVGLTML